MKVFDQYGREVTRPQISISGIFNNNVIINDNGIYLKNITDGLWYKLVCETIDNVVDVYMEQNNTILT